jgi:hypothetical protein
MDRPTCPACKKVGTLVLANFGAIVCDRYRGGCGEIYKIEEIPSLYVSDVPLNKPDQKQGRCGAGLPSEVETAQTAQAKETTIVYLTSEGVKSGISNDRSSC